jgi:PKD repeat protein
VPCLQNHLKNALDKGKSREEGGGVFYLTSLFYTRHFAKVHFAAFVCLIHLALLSGTEAIGGTYTTSFPLTENPISENGNWINGATTGLDWANVATTTGLAYSGSALPSIYGDPTAVLTGTWGPTQIVSAVVEIITPPSGGEAEVELRLRSSMSAHSCTGYELLYSVYGSYWQIVRWDGPLNSFAYIGQSGSGPALKTGDILRGTITNSTMYFYLNGSLLGIATDSTFTSGNPGIGFYPNTSLKNWGFSSFAATDGVASPPVAGFASSPTNGIAPLSVVFTNLSSGASNYAWAFGDGNSSASVNPVNTYSSPGAYSVSLTAVGAGGTNTLTLSNYIVVAALVPVTLGSPWASNGQFGFSFQTLAGQSYSIQQDTDLAIPNWVTATNFLGTGSPYQFRTLATNTQLPVFYRVREP